MRLTLEHGVMLILGVLSTAPAVAYAQGTTAAWLDQPKIASWNTPGQAIPAAPKPQDPVNPSCRNQARPAQTAEDKQVSARGWDLVGAFQGGWQVVVVRGAAGYDGMCRPVQYQDFVFVGGVFAGTLAPKPMDSRTDGAINRVSLTSATQLTAEYARYGKSDALCCPSRTTSVTFEIAKDPPVVRAASAATAQAGGGRP